MLSFSSLGSTSGKGNHVAIDGCGGIKLIAKTPEVEKLIV
jgi:hypothetical protein